MPSMVRAHTQFGTSISYAPDYSPRRAGWLADQRPGIKYPRPAVVYLSRRESMSTLSGRRRCGAHGRVFFCSVPILRTGRAPP
jgi:hypothetical protein